MKKASFLIAAFLFLCLLVSVPNHTEARPLKAISLSQLSPSSCPAGGCAAGQRINVRAEFPVTAAYTAGQNTQVCVYTIQEGGNPWADSSVFSITNTATFTSGEINFTCSNNIPSGDVYLGGANAKFTGASDQQFDFAFRINKLSTAPGSLRISIFQLNATGDTWGLTDGPSDFNVPVVAAASDPAYVANSPGNCAGDVPCYLNSGDDLANGIGTGLKDAVDASLAGGVININGNYLIKSNTVVVDKALLIQGDGNDSLTYNSAAACGNAMILLSDGATIQKLNINDGICVTPSRDLVVINSASNIALYNNDLTNGKNAILVQNNTGNVSVRFNHITGNSGYGILRESGSSTGLVKAVANNIYNNRIGAQAECNNKGEVNHNFWGSGVDPAYAVSRCTYTAGKRLGAAIDTEESLTGVSAEQIELSGSKDSLFSNSISLQGTAGVKLIVANHGNGGLDNIPFIGKGTDNITACSNFWDVFISDENVINPSTLDLFIKYGDPLICSPTVETQVDTYCSSIDPADIPLVWYDPQYSVTDRWDTTGQDPTGSGSSGMNGQATTCDTFTDEIKVTIDSNLTERPNLVSDLNYTPFGVGYQNPAIIFTSFTATAGINKVDLHWETSKEIGFDYFYVTRSLSPIGPYSRDSSLIDKKGGDNIGGIYNYTDLGLDNGTTYWYMLEMIAAPNTSIGFHGPVSGTTASMVPTATEVTPNSVEVYGSSLSIKVKGNNFIPTSKVLWENDLGIDLQTSYISSTELTAILPKELYEGSDSSGLYDLTVYNPGPGGGSSPPLTFTIKNPIPELSSITPITSEGNPTTITINVTGNNFVTDSRVRFNGSDSNITTTFISRTSLKAEVLMSKLVPGVIQITVYNPAYGGGTSAAKSYTLFTPTPTLTKIPTRTTVAPIVQRTRTRTPTRSRTPTVTITGTIFITPSMTPQFTPDLTRSTTPDLTTTGQTTSKSGSATPTLAPGEPTYTPEPPSPGEDTGSSSIFLWRLWSALRILSGSLLGSGLLSIPAFFILKHKTKLKNPQ